MRKKNFQQKTQDSIYKIINPFTLQSFIQTFQKDKTKIERFFHTEQLLLQASTFQQKGHNQFCLKADNQAKLQNNQLAFYVCAKGLSLNPLCQKCLSLYVRLYKIILPRKTPLLDYLLKQCTKAQTIDPSLIDQFRKIKQSQNLDQPYQDFLTDLLQNGAEFSKLSIISQNSDSRSVIAKSQIQKDETILFIPKNKLILLENARDSDIVKKIHQEKLYLRSPKHCELTIYLLQQEELRQKSVYWHYINLFPKNFQMFPINFKHQELEYLKGSPFLDQVEQKSIDITRDYEAICSVCPQFVRFDYQNFKKYRLIVSSRLFGILTDKTRTDALAPFADMLNHNIPKQTSWYYSDPQKGFIIKSMRKIEKGEEVYDSYGLKCNSRFLLNYGFTIADNQANQVAVKIPFQYQEDDKVQIYRQITLKISKNIQSKQFNELVSILRHSVVRQDSISEDWCLDSMKKTPFLDLDIEAQIWQKLQKILEAQIAAYPTTLKEDRKLLSSKELSKNYYNCIILRRGEKQIIHFYLTMAKKMVKYFRGGISLKSTQQLKDYEPYLRQLNFS